MALRVLLADESSTIKKVMQLALQDFGIEVKAVPNGIDVVSVAESFQPDIFFVDILLAKKTGYDVCLELKNNPQFKLTPVVLMWSGFMEIDEKKAQQARPDARLEKPFDGDTLRELVQKLVTKTTSNPVSDFIITPKLPDFEEKAVSQSNSDEHTKTDPVGAKILAALKPKANSDSMDSDEQDDFKQVPLPPIESAAPSVQTKTTHQAPQRTPQVYHPPDTTPPEFEPIQQPNSEEHLDFSKFKINLDQNALADQNASDNQAMSLDEDDNQFVIVSDLEDFDPESSLNVQQTFTQSKVTDPTARAKASPQPPVDLTTLNTKKPQATTPVAPTPPPPVVDPDMVEMMVRDQVRTVIEQVVWKVLPEITEKVIREEINKLLKESEKKFQAKL